MHESINKKLRETLCFLCETLYPQFVKFVKIRVIRVIHSNKIISVTNSLIFPTFDIKFIRL